MYAGEIEGKEEMDIDRRRFGEMEVGPVERIWVGWAK